MYIWSLKFVSDLLHTGRWFSLDTPVSSTNKTDHHDITEILLKVALNTINQIKPCTLYKDRLLPRREKQSYNK